MSQKNIAVFAIFPDQLSAEDALEELKTEGFRNTDVSILFADNQGSRDFTYEKHTKAPEGAVAGGSSGAVIGGAIGWLAGIGALAIPGLGPLIAAGPLVGMLSGAGMGTALGGITGAFLGLDVPEYEARRYQGRIEGGGILVSVHSDNEEWAGKARKLLEKMGGGDVSTTPEEKADYLITDRPVPRTSQDDTSDYLSGSLTQRNPMSAAE